MKIKNSKICGRQLKQCFSRKFIALKVNVQFARATVTKQHKLSALNKRNSLSQSVEGFHSRRNQVLPRLVPSDVCKGGICSRLPSLSSRWLPLHSYDVLSVCMCVSKFPLFIRTSSYQIRDTSYSRMSSSYLN